jgi:hypothetical protein
MKCIRGLSSVALVSFLSINSGVALSKVPEQVPNPTSSAQAEPMIIANPLRIIRDGIRTVDQLNQIRLREQRRQEQEAAQREAAEQRRLEAEREQRYFDSLSPEQQQAYLAEKKQRELETMNRMLGGLMLFGVLSNGAGTDQQDDDDRVCRNERQVGINDYERMTAREARGYGLVCR